MAIVLNINADAAVVFANKLEKLHRSALPSAIRNTLNDAAMLVKKDTLLKSAKDNFKERQSNFFKANSKVDFAKGFNVSTMKATVGMFSNNLKGSDNYAVKDLEQQEHGGTIKGRSFIPLKSARSSSSWNKRVKNKYRISDIGKKVVDSLDNSKGRTLKEKYLRSAIHAGVGGLILGSFRNSNGNRFLYEIQSIGKGGVKSKAIYAVKGDRKVKVDSTDFMRLASLKSAQNLETYFMKEAQKQIARLK